MPNANLTIIPQALFWWHETTLSIAILSSRKFRCRAITPLSEARNEIEYAASAERLHPGRRPLVPRSVLEGCRGPRKEAASTRESALPPVPANYRDLGFEYPDIRATMEYFRNCGEGSTFTRPVGALYADGMGVHFQSSGKSQWKSWLRSRRPALRTLSLAARGTCEMSKRLNPLNPSIPVD